MYLHGCGGAVQGLMQTGFENMEEHGFTQYAAANNLIIIYP